VREVQDEANESYDEDYVNGYDAYEDEDEVATEEE
jgi:hypothetical protein